MLYEEGNRLVFRYDADLLWIEPWGQDAFRVRSTKTAPMPQENWALLPQDSIKSKIDIGNSSASITNGKITAVVTKSGHLNMHNNVTGQNVLTEYTRNRRDVTSELCSALQIEAREFKPIIGGDYEVTARFESVDFNERIYGMGQYQQPNLNLKGSVLELAHRNSQASVPFALSSLGYGFLWNNPSIGEAVLGTNVMQFKALSTKALDYWIEVGDSPRELTERYSQVTGRVPMMPEFGLGFWQCKLRYQTQEELLQVAREYRKRELPLDLIVIDFFHWPKQGEWKFDPVYWPDPDAMLKELKELDVQLMVSIWPTVDKTSENFDEMLEQGLLIRAERGIRTVMEFQGGTVHFDATNPAARAYVWQKVRLNYYDRGIKVFWLDEAEPEYTAYDFDNYRYHAGSNLAIGNTYPFEYSKAFFEGMTAEGQSDIVNLVRCAWAGSQRFGALVWSGDISSTWRSLRNQLMAGLNMGIAGFPWWTTDIGGFHGGDPDDEAFRELFVRWFQWGAFCPVMRLHGDREPRQPQHGTTGGATCRSGAANEVWSYGPDVYEICKTYMDIREQLRPYTRGLMKEAHERGTPVIRTMFYEFPDDEACCHLSEQYMFGDKYLCCPVLAAGQTKLKVYLPDGKWSCFYEEREWQGGQTVEVECPLHRMPVFCRA